MSILLRIIAVIFILIILFFLVLQLLSNRSYKPSKEDVRKIIQASIDDSLSLGEFDEFSCVHIAYDKNLERIREKYNQIVSNPQYIIESEVTEDNATALNRTGKNKLLELIREIS